MKPTKHSLSVAYLIVTWFKSGLSPKAPGTMGSLATLPLAFVMIYFYGTLGIAVSAVLIFILGLKATQIVLKDSIDDQDPGFVVVDETVGQLLAFLFVAHLPINLWAYIFGFAFFRIFDIIKKGPVGYCDKNFHGAFGVMFDDVVAGLMAAGCLWILYYIYPPLIVGTIF